MEYSLEWKMIIIYFGWIFISRYSKLCLVNNKLILNTDNNTNFVYANVKKINPYLLLEQCNVGLKSITVKKYSDKNCIYKCPHFSRSFLQNYYFKRNIEIIFAWMWTGYGIICLNVVDYINAYVNQIDENWFSLLPVLT